MPRPDQRAQAATPYSAAFGSASPLARDCPRCGAKRGYSCMAIRGDIPKRLKETHRERSRAREEGEL